jgi:hypothetical protein
MSTSVTASSSQTRRWGRMPASTGRKVHNSTAGPRTLVPLTRPLFDGGIPHRSPEFARNLLVGASRIPEVSQPVG